MKTRLAFVELVVVIVTAALANGCCSLFPAGDAEHFTVNNVYGSHMVLQRQKPIQIVGSADAGKCVTVSIGKHCVAAKADQSGEWKAVLPAMEAGGPYTVTVSGAEGTAPIVFDDVLIGEVWLCSGQSNMHLPVRRCLNPESEIAAANHPRLRLFQMPRTDAPDAKRTSVHPACKWRVCSPAIIRNFSGCGYYFGRQLLRELDVPVGIIQASWGGTRIEPWISREAYDANDRPRESELARIAASPDAGKQLEEFNRKSKASIHSWLKAFDAFSVNEACQRWASLRYDDSFWGEVVLPGYTFPTIGVSWFRRTVELPAKWANKPVTLFAGVIDDLDETFFNGEKVGSFSADTPLYWCTERVYKIPEHLVKSGKNVLAIRIRNIAGNGSLTAPKTGIYLKCGNETIALDGKWKMREEFTADLKKIGKRPEYRAMSLGSMQYPTTFYNGMIHPWTVYPIRGILWYQGCSNDGEAEDYSKLHPMLIRDWRNKWNEPEMPFIVAQLAAYQYGSATRKITMEYMKNLLPGEDSFSELREVQSAMRRLPGTGVVVTIDIGDPSDIHPLDKQTLGFRMVQEAKRLAYGFKGVSAGPVFKSMRVEGEKIRIEFTNTGSGLTAPGGKPGSFVIAGEDAFFVRANAKLDGNTVLVWSDEVRKPVHVRYAWAGFPLDANLYNKEGFPAGPFRTDVPDYLVE